MSIDAMIDNKAQSGAVDYNFYIVREFPASLLSALSTAAERIIGVDAKFSESLGDVGRINYGRLLQLKERDGSIGGRPLEDYFVAIQNTCKWAAVDVGYLRLFE